MTQIMEKKGLIGPNPTFDFPHATQSLDWLKNKFEIEVFGTGITAQKTNGKGSEKLPVFFFRLLS